MMKRIKSHEALSLLFQRYDVTSVMVMYGPKDQTLGQLREIF